MSDPAPLIPNRLYMGSRPEPRDPSLRRNFDILVFCAMEVKALTADYPGLHLVRLKLDDPKIDEHGERAAIRAARYVAGAVQHDARVLVTCAMGLNRSGLVSGLSLVELGCTAKDAIAHIRERRGNVGHLYPLFNKRFCAIIEGYEARGRRRNSSVA